MKQVEFKNWADGFFDLMCDKHPVDEGDEHAHPPWYLPSGVNLKVAWATYTVACKGSGYPHYEYAHFAKMVHREYPWVHVSNRNTDFKCDVCCALVDALRAARCGMDAVRVKQLLADHKVHMSIMKSEREKYRKHKRKAKEFWRKYLSLIIDGKDPSNTYLLYDESGTHNVCLCPFVFSETSQIRGQSAPMFSYY
jgi:hypothetical protein